MSFSDARWLIALWALPVLVLLELLAVRRRTQRLRQLVGDRRDHALLAQYDRRSAAVGAGLRVVALGALVFGACGPEWGREIVRRGSTGSDVVLVVDVSASMDARDVPPSRIDEARREALVVLDRLEGSRVGVVAFAGDAVRLVPLTLDLAAARLTVESLSTGSVSTPGTDLGRALDVALRVMPPGRRDEQAIVLWTDGEDLERGASAAIDAVARSGIRVFAVGVGTREGDVVPVLDADGHVTDVKRDESGNVVRSQLDEDLLRALAQRTHGAYFPASRPGGELGRLLGAVEGLARAGRTQRLTERPVPRFPLFAALAALLLAADQVRRRRRREDVDRGAATHSERGAAAAAVLIVLLVAPRPAAAQSAWARGDRAFRHGAYSAAESLYALRLRHGGPEAVRVNQSTAKALAGKSEDAEKDLERLTDAPGGAGDAAGYNLGTLRARRHDDDAALAALRRTLEQHPDDADARWNYEVVLRRQQQHQSPKPNPQSQKSGGGGGGGGAPKPQPQQPNPQPQQPSPQPSPTPPSSPPPPSGGGGSMTREQADRLLNALQEMARADQQKRRNVRPVTEKRGKDW